MLFFKSLLVAAATLATSAYAQGKLQFTVVPQSIQGGKSYTIKWTGASGPATIVLRKGESTNLKTLATLTTSGSGGSFQWNVDNSLVSGNDYALQITAGGQTNYQGPLSIAAAGTPTVSTSSVSKTSSRTSASSTSSSMSTTKSTTTTKSVSTKVETKTSTKTTSSSSTSESSPSQTSSSSAPQDSDGAAANVKSNGALLLGALAAMAYFS